MNLLALDTGTEVAGVALLEEERLRFSHSFLHRMDLSQRLLPAVEWLLRDAGLTAKDVGALAVGLGPGSFTGVRIGVTTAKVLAQVAGLPVVGVGTLEVMAASALACTGLLVCPCIDARKSQVYAALYRMGAEAPEEVLPPRAVDAGALAAELAGREETILFVGTGAVRYRDAMAAPLGTRFRYLPGHDFPDAAVLAHLGRRLLDQGRRDDPLLLKPVYVRPSEAERVAGCEQ